MILKFNKADSRKLELWAASLGIDINGEEKVWTEAIAWHVLQFVEAELAKCRPKGEAKPLDQQRISEILGSKMMPVDESPMFAYLKNKAETKGEAKQ